LKGTPIIFNGEEIGMENYPFKSPKDFKDVNAKMIFDNAQDINIAFENLKETSRDHGRTIMQWNSNKNAGFSEVEPWTYVNSNYKKVNVEKAQADDGSILNNYIRLLAVRRELGKHLMHAKYKFFNKQGVIGYTIFTEKDRWEVVANLSKKDCKYNMIGSELLYSNMAQSDKLKRYQIVIVHKNAKE